MNRFFDWILNLFGRNKKNTSPEAERNSKYETEYRDTKKFNITAVFANTLSTLAVYDSTMSVSADNARGVLLSEFSKKLWKKTKKAVSTALGTGGCVVIPYVQNGNLYFNIVSQGRLFINEMTGDRITDAFILADRASVNNHTYLRWANYKLTDGVVSVKTIVTDAASGALTHTDIWKDIDDLSISGCDRLLFGFIKCPVDNRRDSDDYGVPITYGTDDTKDKIKKAIEEIEDEFEYKKTRIFADNRLFDVDEKGNRIMPGKVFTAVKVETDDLIKEFSPDIREASFYSHLDKLFERMEKLVGTSRGILTSNEAMANATATEIRRGMMNTGSIIDNTRENVMSAYEDVLYACNVLANAYGLTPPGEYTVSYDWSKAYMEDVAFEWQQIKDARADGIISRAEERVWLKNETIDEAQAAIDQIKENEPSYDMLIGG